MTDVVWELHVVLTLNSILYLLIQNLPNYPSNNRFLKAYTVNQYLLLAKHSYEICLIQTSM